MDTTTGPSTNASACKSIDQPESVPRMYIDKDQALASELSPLVFDMERSRIRFFAETVGLTDPIYFDTEAARAAGHPDIVVPPTFLGNSLELEISEPLSWLGALGVDLDTTTHGEQSFEYHSLAYGGEQLTFERSIVDVYLKKGGALEFVVKQSKVHRQNGEPVATVLCTLGIKHEVKQP